jgi:hypothetical protein
MFPKTPPPIDASASDKNSDDNRRNLSIEEQFFTPTSYSSSATRKEEADGVPNDDALLDGKDIQHAAATTASSSMYPTIA